MNSLLLPMLFGMNVSPELIKNMMDEKAKSLDKWRLALRLLVTLVAGGAPCMSGVSNGFRSPSCTDRSNTQLRNECFETRSGELT